MAEIGGITGGSHSPGGWTPAGTRYLGGHRASGMYMYGMHPMAMRYALGALVLGGWTAAAVPSRMVGSAVAGRVFAGRAVAYAARTSPVAARAMSPTIGGVRVRSMAAARGQALAMTRYVAPRQFARGVRSAAVPILGLRATLSYAAKSSIPRAWRGSRLLGHGVGAALIAGGVQIGRTWYGSRPEGGGGPGAGGSESSGRGSMCEHYSHCL